MVGNVKPHYNCKDPDNRVATYIQDLVKSNFEIIVLNQMEFAFPEPEGYVAFGGACVHTYADEVVVLVQQSSFEVLRPIGDTILGPYSAMPWMTGVKPTSGDLCFAAKSGGGTERSFAGAVVRHTESFREFCLIAGTLPHWDAEAEAGTYLNSTLLDSIKTSCENRHLLFVLDTNVSPNSLTVGDIGAHENAGWGTCSDLGAAGAPTCCYDGYSETDPFYKFDRTAVCRGGLVEQWKVADHYVCETNEEHRYTTAAVTLMDEVDVAVV
jgi:hypothetical protein